MSENGFFQNLSRNSNPVVVDFWAPWCGPCKMIDPTLKKLEQEYAGKVEVWKVNADEQPEVLQRLRIYGIPTVIGFKDGQEVVRQTGAANRAALEGVFEAALMGVSPAKAETPLTWLDRLIRIAIGAIFLYLAYLGSFQGIFVIFVAMGAIALFSAVHDRCPVWQAIKPRLKALIGQNTSV
jgi:thioredoxin